MKRRSVLFSAPAVLLAGCAAAQSRPDNAALARQGRGQGLDSGGLADSTGPVLDPDGKLFARCYSTWRREAPDVWRIVFDDGCNFKCP